MRAVVITYKLTDEEYPTLNEIPKETLEMYVRQGYTVLDVLGYDEVPKAEQSLDNPVAVSIVG